MNRYYGLARFLEKVMLDDIDAVRRLPEYLRGDIDIAHRLNSRIVEVQDDTYQRVNRLEQPPQDVQAWTAAAIYAIKVDDNNGNKHSESALKPLEKELLEDIKHRSSHWRHQADEILKS